MKRMLLLLIGIPFYSILDAQNIKQYVKQNTYQIDTNQPDSIHFKDLEIIGNAIEDAQIVFLGEQDHGDAPSFLAKTRIIKYLHEKKGFNVLAFESDFFALNFGWDHLTKTKKETDAFLLTNIFPIWTMCDACENLLYQYIPSTLSESEALQIAGFDNQMVLQYSYKKLSSTLDSVLRAYNLPITREANYTSEIIPLVDSLKRYQMKDTSQYSKQLAYLLMIKGQLLEKLPAESFWIMLVDNLIAENNEYRNIKQYTKSTNTRDRQMAENLLWLAKNKYPKEKIIVWAHNTHISKYAGHYNHRFLDKRNSMGSVFDEIKDSTLKTYTIGFTSYNGTAGRLGSKKTVKLKPPKKNSFENWINKSYNFAFVDFKKYNQAAIATDNHFAMKGARHNFNQQAVWNKIFDGVFFVREMYPCKVIPKFAQKK